LLIKYKKNSNIFSTQNNTIK